MAHRKWIDKRIAQLDPKTDYDEIWELSSSYRLDDFSLNVGYTLTVPHLTMRAADIAPLADSRKMWERPHAREDDSMVKFATWWSCGAESQQTIDAVNVINKIHVFYAKQLPESFNINEAYLYTLCYQAAGAHRLARRIGRPGFTAVQKQAAVEFWSRMCAHFDVVGTEHTVQGFPDTFEGVEKFMDEWENEDLPDHGYGSALMDALLAQFLDRFVPRPLHPLARTWMLSLYPDAVLAVHHQRKPPQPVVALLRFLTRIAADVNDYLAPDPSRTWIAQRRERSDTRQKIKKLDAVFRAEHPDTGPEDANDRFGDTPIVTAGATSGCPYAAARSALQAGSTT